MLKGKLLLRGPCLSMVYAIKVIVGFLLPPGIMVVLLVTGSLWFRHLKPLSGVTLVAAVLLYVISIPLTADAIMRHLESRYAPVNPNAIQPPGTPLSHGETGGLKADVLIMLGAGATLDTPGIGGTGNLFGSGANRLLTTADLYRVTKLPIIVSGGQVFPDDGNEAQIAKRELLLLGVPAAKVIAEDKSKNTTQNAVFTKQLMQQYGFHHPLLITSAFHMPRAVLDFQQQGVTVLPYPTDYQVSQSFHLYVNQFVPSAKSLALLSTALHEYLGTLAARLHLPS